MAEPAATTEATPAGLEPFGRAYLTEQERRILSANGFLGRLYSHVECGEAGLRLSQTFGSKAQPTLENVACKLWDSGVRTGMLSRFNYTKEEQLTEHRNNAIGSTARIK